MNLRFVAFCMVNVSRFNRKFVIYAANVNDFKLWCRMILVVDGTRLNGPFKGTLVAACTLDADNHLFNFTYGIVCGETIAKWV